MYSLLKNEIIIRFSSKDDDSASNVVSMFLNMLKENNTELQDLRVYINREGECLEPKENKSLDSLRTDVKNINKNKDIF